MHLKPHSDLQRTASRWGLALAVVLLSACAQVPRQQAATPASTDAAAPKTTPTTVAAAGLMGYEGTFLSPCGELIEGLHAVDTITVKPVSSTEAVVVYRKRLFGQAECPVMSHIITVEQPEARWHLVGEAEADGKAVQRIRTDFAAGELKVQVSNPERVETTDEAFVLKFGPQGRRIPLTRKTEAQTRQDIHRLEGDRLRVGDPGSVDDTGFPKALDASEVLFKVPTRP